MASQSKNNSEREHIRTIVITGLMTALVFAGSRIGFHTPSITGGGYVHLGTAFMFFTAFVFGRKAGAFAAGVGMGLFDLFSEYAVWAPFTFAISLLMGYFAGKIARSEDGSLSFFKCGMAFVVCTFIKVSGYYLTEVILYQNLVSPLASIPGNITQMLAGIVVGSALAAAVLKQKTLSFGK
ncbi:MAG: ECF transporter S component [Clostridiales bacterium]|nr:ECF transporter S component [Clostridiales bacterium]